jgi:DNA-binding LytR/AlgR family response regulator
MRERARTTADGMAKRLMIELLVILAIGLLMGLLGPFGTFAMAPGVRIFSWIVWILVGYLLFRPTGIVADWLCEATGLPSTAGMLIALALAGFPLTLLVTMMIGHASLSVAMGYDGFWTIYAYIAIVSVVVSMTMKALFAQAGDPATAQPSAPPLVPPSLPQPDPTPSTPPDAVSAAPAGFERRLPPGFGALLALKGEDHYVRAIGAAREELILLRLSDAIGELPADAGLRVHRSWWVARDAVSRVERDGRAARLILTNGATAPVSRDAMARLREAGWL